MNRCPIYNFFKYWREYKKWKIIHVRNTNVCLCRIIMNACSNNNFICTQLYPTLIYMIQKKLDKYIERVQAVHNNH